MIKIVYNILQTIINDLLWSASADIFTQLTMFILRVGAYVNFVQSAAIGLPANGVRASGPFVVCVDIPPMGGGGGAGAGGGGAAAVSSIFVLSPIISECRFMISSVVGDVGDVGHVWVMGSGVDWDLLTTHGAFKVGSSRTSPGFNSMAFCVLHFIASQMTELE